MELSKTNKLLLCILPVFLFVILGTSGFFDSLITQEAANNAAALQPSSSGVILESRSPRMYSSSLNSEPSSSSRRKGRSVAAADEHERDHHPSSSSSSFTPTPRKRNSGARGGSISSPTAAPPGEAAAAAEIAANEIKTQKSDQHQQHHDPPLPPRELHQEEKKYLDEEKTKGGAGAKGGADEFEHPLYHGNPNSKHCQLPTAQLGRGTVLRPAKNVAIDKHSQQVAGNVKMLFDESLKEVNIRDGIVVPGIVIPTFKDGDVLRQLLQKFDTPVRHFVFICNANDDKVDAVMRELQPLEAIGAVTIFKYRGFNRGFSTSVNLGFRRAREILFGKSEYAFLPAWPKLAEVWYFAVNCDAIFRPGSAQLFATSFFKDLRTTPAQRSSGLDRFRMSYKLPVGLAYGNVVDHYAFGVTQAAIDVAGYFDEVYWPGYNEDVDFSWRVHLAGFRSQSFPAARIDHHQSINLKRAGGQSLYRQQIHRQALGFEYGWMKHGIYNQAQTRMPFPPSGRSSLFGVPGFPLHLWRVDPVHRRCIVTGEGVYFVRSSTCWYNGTVLLEWLPEGARLPRFLREPTISLRDWLGHGRNNSRWE